MGFFSKIMMKELGDLSNPTMVEEEIEAREKEPIWRLKGVVCQSSHRLLKKFGNPKLALDNKDHRVFAVRFCETMASDLLDSHLYLISQAKDSFVGQKALIHSLKFVNGTLLNSLTV
jgi:hypothetical protein